MKATPLILASGCLLAFLAAGASADVLVRIDGLLPGELAVRGFELDREQEVELRATDLDLRRHPMKEKTELTAAWILDAASREVVWSTSGSRPVERRGGLRDYAETLRLGAGVYEVYYATFPKKHRYGDEESWWESAARSFAKWLGWEGDAEALEAAFGDLELVVRGDGRALDEEALGRSRDDRRREALVSLAATADHFSAESGFVLEKPLELELYAVGELLEDGGYDYGWIIDAETREKVWRFTYGGSEEAGGSDKNRRERRTLRLPAGRYAAFFVTDDSHSPGRWNTLPPRDPAFWGLTLWVAEPSERRYARNFEYRDLPGDERVLVELTRLRDGESRSQGFTLRTPMEVRLYAVGEGLGHGHGMADYGWIVDARTRQRVWTMEYERTEHAGGGKKNRLADEVLRLDAGSYLVGFVTDDSHAYRDWNTAPPTHPERWGITLFAVGEAYDPSQVAEYREDDDPAILARIARVRSDSHRRQDFSLDHGVRVYLYAVGEGSHGEMHDYGWLEDARTGRTIWRMDYPQTDRAGGAVKNRLYRGTLDLEAGDYVLHYRTDDSHAYHDWNANPPHDPESWGIQVALAEGGD